MAAPPPTFSFLRTLSTDDFQTFPGRLTDQAKRAFAISSENFAGKHLRLGFPSGSRSPQYSSVDISEVGVNEQFSSAFHELAMNLPDPFKGRSFRLLAAERDIKPESQGSRGQSWDIAPDGTGATRALEWVLHSDTQDNQLVEDVLRRDLNEIVGPDAHFTRVDVQRIDGDYWTVVLDEKGKGRIPLGHSGSGLKTILLVLVKLVIEPVLSAKPANQCIFAFEELENYVHPGLQRRLLTYIDRKAREDDFVVFLTTHAPAIIDLFADKEHAQIIHVTHDGSEASCAITDRLAAGHQVLDDLDVRASDLLQANGIVWVEGVSDRVYVGRWLGLLCEEMEIEPPVEGTEFTFLEYGGKCLSHYDFGSLDALSAKDKDLSLLIPALRVSRNHFVVVDSDRGSKGSPLRETKKRVIEEAQFHWLTDGREVENYLQPSVAREVLGFELGRWDSAIRKKKYDKRAVADRATLLMTEENWERFELRAMSQSCSKKYFAGTGAQET